MYRDRNDKEEYIADMYDENFLLHYGVKRRSGRYPWGSGDTPFQRSGDFLSRIESLAKQGIKEADIAAYIAKDIGKDFTTTDLRAAKSIAVNERKLQKINTAKSLAEDGLTPTEIGRKMGINESTVRGLLKDGVEERRKSAVATADFLRKQVDEKVMIDVGKGVERDLGISREKMNQALYILQMEGYHVYGGGVPQVTNKGKQTNLSVLTKPDVEHKEIFEFDRIQTIMDYTSLDGGASFKKAFEYPTSLDSKRLQIRYAEDGGTQMDGVIELRRGVKDLSLGDARYSQVRIMVDDRSYLKGMAVYADDLPPGIDVRFNTNRKKGSPLHGDESNDPSVPTVLKKKKNDPDNPFGSLIKEHGGQSYYDDPDGKYIDPVTGKRQSLGLINKRSSEHDWSGWGDSVPSQFLAKQNLSLINKQLSLTIADKENEYKEIMALDNPSVKKVLLNSFSSDCDSAAEHLKAAALPRQKYHVILPLTTISDKEVYAPNYEDGEKVALIRYPHAGTFEIPILTVNNKNKQGQKMMGKNAVDAVGINSKVAEQLSGADFDGDTVMVIPTRGNGKNLGVNITATHPLKDLEGFDNKAEYPYREGMKIMKDTGKQMGVISNLITDMTLQGANESELARAVKHSMVVIDAEKHKLDYKKSEIDNGIAELKQKYQGHYDENGRYHEGAGTIISRAKSQQSVLKRQGSPTINPETGELIWKTSNKAVYVDAKTGKVKERTQKSTKMAETNDARTLIGDPSNLKEQAYAKHANRMKELANRARKEMLATGKIKYSAEAKKEYQMEVDSLMAKLNNSMKMGPRERKAQLIANSVVKAKKEANPDMTKSELKKESQRALTSARLAVGAKRIEIDITPREWEAIQKGAISESKLMDIINRADIDKVRDYATPKTRKTISTAKMSKLNTMVSSGNYSVAEIAKALGVSTSTVRKYMKG